MLDYTLFGESHGPVVGVLLRHVPAGVPIDELQMERDLLRRRPSGALATARQEPDEVQFLSGVFQGRTTGMPLVMALPNRDARPQDYEVLRSVARPGHADYTARIKAKGFQDYRGGGHFSGRLTAPLVAAGSIAKTVLASQGVTVTAHVVDEENLRRRAAEAKEQGDSVGGQVVCTVTGLTAGLGGPDWPDTVDMERMENVTLSAAGRHDSCIALRAAPIVEAAAALAICQLWQEEPTEDLAGYRGAIDKIDGEIVALLAKRLQIGSKIGALKAAAGTAVRDEAREAEVLRSRGDMAPEYRTAVEAVFRAIMAQTRQVEQE